ncbi:MAG: cation:proton antiporter [Phycisphaerae bacterium]|jgi:CPA2 family monovalent cation:H+ antiporter-2|nr:cation:proton antiporter [Phycisphaerae bacterium]
MLSPSLGFTLAAATQELPLLTTIAAAFVAAWVCGLLAKGAGLSPIVGYLVGGILIGPYTPGFTGNKDIALELAEIGVILLLFGVGLHFHLKDLWSVRWVAFPGAVGQSAMATLAAVVLFGLFGWEVRESLLLGGALAVASTVVLLRALTDRGSLQSTDGHIAIGWLIVEDLFTVVILAVVPLLAAGGVGETSTDVAGAAGSGAAVVAWAIGKLVAMVLVVLVVGSWIVPRVLSQVARLRSTELFTLTVLVFSIAIAVGSAVLFGASVALGAFLAGMVVAQSPVSHQAGADALPMRDAFGVLFFVSIGMLFDPSFLLREPGLVIVGAVIVLLVKPLAALAIVALLGYSATTALTVAVGLAQIGEFSFILAGAASNLGLLPKEATHVLVATAMLSIALNPLLFALLPRMERALRRQPTLWRLLNARHESKTAAIARAPLEPAPPEGGPLAVIVGYGPVGRIVDALLRDAKIRTLVIDLNVDTVHQLRSQGRLAIYGDAGREGVLAEASITAASHVILTLPQPEGKSPIVSTIRRLNPGAHITVRARYLGELDDLTAAGASSVIIAEGEVGMAMARHVLEMRGVEARVIARMIAALRSVWRLDSGGPVLQSLAPRLSTDEADQIVS